MLLEFTLANLILFAHIIRPIDNIDTQQVFMFVCSTVLFESFAFVDVVILVDEMLFYKVFVAVYLAANSLYLFLYVIDR